MRQRKIVVWHNVEHCSILVILWDTKLSDCHQICPFYSRTVRQLHLLACQMECWSVCAWEQLCSCFPIWQIYIFKTTFHHDNLILAFPTLQKRWSFPCCRNERETSSTHLDSFSTLTIAQKSELKNQAIPPSRLDWGTHADAAPFSEERAKSSSQTSQPHRALLGPTASYTFKLGHCVCTFLAPSSNVHFERKQTETKFWKYIPT